MITDEWLFGYISGEQSVIEAVKRAMKENPNMPLKDLLVRIKVAALTRKPQVDDE